MCDTCQPTCIDLIATDQPNLVLDSGVRDWLDSRGIHISMGIKAGESKSES